MAALVLVLWPALAHADVIIPFIGLLWWPGWIVIAGVSLVEFLVLRLIFPCRWRRILVTALVANLASTAAGFFVQLLYWLLNSYIFSVLPNSMFLTVLSFSGLAATCCLASAWLESLVLREELRRHVPSPARFFRASLIANAVSYALLVPVMFIPPVFEALFLGGFE